MGDDLPFVDLGGDYNATHLSDSPGTNSNYCAVLHPDGEIKCWGYAATGALGQGTTTNAEMGDALPAVRTAHGPKLSVAVAGVGPWTCTLDDDNDFCAPRTITLSSVGNDTVEWLLVPEAGRVYANGTGGKLEPGETATVALSIEEAALAFGSNDVSATLYTSETGPQCHPGRLDGSVQGATCEVHNFTGTVTMDASASAWAWISSGMVVLPRSHMLEVVLDEGLEVNSSALLVDRAVEAAPYDVTVTGDSGCATLMSVPAGASGQLKRMQNQLMAFEVDGTDLASGSPTACSASVRRVDSGKVENITFTVTGRPGAPSTKSLVMDASGTASAPLQVTFQSRDRLSAPCDRPWGVAFSAVAIGADGVQHSLPGTSSPTNSANHELSIQSLGLAAGEYTLRGFVVPPNATAGLQLEEDAALSVSPRPPDPAVACVTGEVATTGGSCTCARGFYRGGESCVACPVNTYKTSDGEAASCENCHSGALTLGTGSTSAGDCTCQANSQLNAAGDTCECAAGHYNTGGPGLCAPCSTGAYKEGAGDTSSCVSCPAGGTTIGLGSTNRRNCTALKNVEVVGQGFGCSPGYYGPADACVPCQLGSFKAEAGDAIVCDQCVYSSIGPGSTTLALASTSVADCVCQSGFYAIPGGGCEPCPEGAICEGQAVELLELKPGYWRASAATLNIHRCEQFRGEELCVGGHSGPPSRNLTAGRAPAVTPGPGEGRLCRDGHDGNLCTACADGYGKRRGLCRRCSSTRVEGYLYVAVGGSLVFVGIFLLVAQHLRRVDNGKEVGKQRRVQKLVETPIGAASMLPFWGQQLQHGSETNGGRTGQFISVPSGMAIDCQKPASSSPGRGGARGVTISVVKVMVTWLQLSSLASSVQVPKSPPVRTLLDWQSLGNVSPWSFSSFNCVVPIGFYQRFYACCLVPVGCAALGAAVVGARALLGRRRLAGLEGDVGIMATQLLWLLTYTMVTEAVMSVFVCRELDDGYWVLSRDVEVECGTPQHRRARRVGVVMLALHTAGVPLQAALLMGGPRGARDQLRMRVRFGFLYENFRDATFWYECFGMLRKASMVAVVTFFQDQTGIQVFTVSWVALTYLTVSVRGACRVEGELGR